jgi:hypothetical protein
MAFLILRNGKAKVVGPEQGSLIWRIMAGELPGTPAQRRFTKNVKRIYLNPGTAPRTYLRWLRSQDTPKPKRHQAQLPYKD